MNEYTRREEMRATAIAAVLLVLAMAGAVGLLVTAQGPLVPDTSAQLVADEAQVRAAGAKTCAQSAASLVVEIDVFRRNARAARLSTPEPEAPPKKPRWKPRKKEPEPDVELAWPAAQPAFKYAKALTICRVPLEAAVGEDAELAPAWKAIDTAAAVTPPGEDKTEQVKAARELLHAFQDAPVEKVAASAKAVEASTKAEAERLAGAAAGAVVRAPLPQGLLSRQVALAIGVGLGVLGLLLSFVSVRAASHRRLTMLVPLRKAARQGEPGAHAAGILRVAAGHNGGEPGLVVGAALGGVAAAAAFRADADLFVAGVMTGLLLGLSVQWLFRLARRSSKWRTRAIEIADIEKPSIPIVLVLGSVNVGLESEFLDFFSRLSPADAAMTVEKLAAQAEERILAAADAGAEARSAAMQGAPHPGAMG